MKVTLVRVGLVLALASVFSANAFADVTGITVRFGGGCVSDNTEGSCTLKVTASGTDLDTETVRLYTAASSTEALRVYSKNGRSLTESGQATIRVKNVAGGCYQVRTGPNGNDKPDVKSRTKCE